MFSKLLLVLGIAFGYGSNLTLETNNNFSHTQARTYEMEQVGYGQYFVSNGSVALGGSGNYARYWYFIIPMETMNTLNDTDNVILTDDIPNVLRYHLFGGFIGASTDTRVLSFSNNDDTPIFGRSINMANSMYYGNRNLFNQLNYIPVDLINREYHLYQFYHNDNVLDNYYHLLIEIQGSWSGYIDETYLSTEEAIIKGVFGGGINEPSLYSGSFSSYWYDLGYNDGLQDGYDNGFSDAEEIADGTWLGNLVFGTIGGIVGFLFALSDFEVLGVSIMSIITLFVAIGIVRLLLKVLR